MATYVLIFTYREDISPECLAVFLLHCKRMTAVSRPISRRLSRSAGSNL